MVQHGSAMNVRLMPQVRLRGVAVNVQPLAKGGEELWLRTLSFDLVSHDTSICWRRMEMVPEMQSMHGMMHIRPGRAMVWKAPKRSMILTVPDEVVMQQQHDMVTLGCFDSEL
jgi:hypothetical protein